MKLGCLIVLVSLSSAVVAQDRAPRGALDRCAEALGGRERLAAVKSLRKVYKARMAGLDGRLEEWSTKDGSFRMRLDLGVVEIVRAYDGNTAWQRDQNGAVARMSGPELLDLVWQGYWATWSCLLDGRVRGHARDLGDEAGAHKVELAPEGGRKTTVWFDAKTGLPARTEAPSGDQLQVTRFSDWQRHDGIQFAGKVEQVVGKGKAAQVATYELETVEVNAKPPAGTFGKPRSASPKPSFVRGSSVRDIPIELNSVHIYLQLRINDSEPKWFLFDTGAGATVLSQTVADELGIESLGKARGRGAGEGSVPVSFARGVRLGLPGVRIPPGTVALIPLTEIEKRTGRELDGILGYDFIRQFVVEIDYVGRKMHLHDPATWKYAGKGRVVRLQLQGNRPIAAATITSGGRPIPAQFLIDTGANAGLMFAGPFTKQHELLEKLDKKLFFRGGYGVGGESTGWIGRLDRLEFGGLKFDRPLASFSEDKAGAGADPDYAGILGGRILSCCRVFVDYSRERLILEPYEHFAPVVPRNLSGLFFVTGGRGKWHEISVARIVPTSPAAEAGFAEGDRIASVDGRPIREFTKHALEVYLGVPGKTVRIGIDRGGNKKELVVELRRWL